MSREFDQLRATFAMSLAGRLMYAVVSQTEAAWHSSAIVSGIRQRLRGHDAPTIIRIAAIAVAVGSLMQPLLIWVMPRMARPAVPLTAFLIVAMFSVAVAASADQISRAWPSSVVPRLLKR